MIPPLSSAQTGPLTPSRAAPSQLAWATALYAALALLYCHPLFLVGFSQALPNDLGDPLLNTWILWWNSQAVPLTERWWNAPAFFPAPGVLSFSETLLSMALVTTPLLWLGASPAAAYNVVFVASFLGCALAGYLLCRACGAGHRAALVGGAYFGFGPHRAVHLPQVQIMWAWWMPLLFVGLFRYRQTDDRRYLLLVGVAWVGTALSSVYYLLYASVGAALWGAWFVARPSRRRQLTALVVSGTLAGLAVLPVMLPYLTWHRTYDLRRNIGEMESFSADLLSVLDGAHILWTWPNVAWLDRAEASLYPGLLTVVLLMAAMWSGRARPAATNTTTSRPLVITRVLVATGLLLVVIGLVAAWSGGGRFRVLGLEIGLSTPHKPIGAGCLLWLAAALTGQRLRDSWRQASVIGFWTVCAATSYLLALGPTGHVGGYQFWYKAPYSWLMVLPGFDSARVPARFGMLLALAVAVLVAIAVERLAGTRRWLAGAALAGVLLDGAITMPAVALPAAPAAEGWPADLLFEVPLDVYRDAAAMAGSFRHGRPVVNGYSGFAPSHYKVLQSAIQEGRLSILDPLRRRGRLAVIADPRTGEGEAWASRLQPYARPDLPAPDGRRVFILPQQDDGEGACLAGARWPELGSAGQVAAVQSPGADPDALALALDGQAQTFFTISEATRTGQGIEVTLPQPRAIRGVVLWMGPVPDDHPGVLRVVGTDSTGVRTLFEGDVAGRAMAGALADPRGAPLAICFPPVTSGVLNVFAPADSDRPWNVAEVSVLPVE